MKSTPFTGKDERTATLKHPDANSEVTHSWWRGTITNPISIPFTIVLVSHAEFPQKSKVFNNIKDWDPQCHAKFTLVYLLHHRSMTQIHEYKSLKTGIRSRSRTKRRESFYQDRTSRLNRQRFLSLLFSFETLTLSHHMSHFMTIATFFSGFYTGRYSFTHLVLQSTELSFSFSNLPASLARLTNTVLCIKVYSSANTAPAAKC